MTNLEMRRCSHNGYISNGEWHLYKNELYGYLQFISIYFLDDVHYRTQEKAT